MKWIFLSLAILLEVCGTTMMKLSKGMTSVGYSIGMFVAYALCFAVLSLALKDLEVSKAYAIWSGVGISLITIIGILLFNESVSLNKIVFLTFIVIGVVGLNFTGVAH